MLYKLLDLLYPKTKKCALCGLESRDIVCELCMSKLRFIEGRCCISCGKSIDDDYKDCICPDCKNVTHSFDCAYSVFEYSGIGKKLIHEFKYNNKTELKEILARQMVRKIHEENIKADYIISVPIHESKLKKRGFNQSKLLADRISECTGIKGIEALIRKKDTKSQYNLDRLSRNLNIFGAFCINPLYNINCRSVLLIDDIYTTGATADECSKVLKTAGAARIVVLTAATGKNT